MSADERAAWCATRDAETAAAELLDSGIPAAAMVPGYATLDDPQLRARGFFEAIDHPHVGHARIPDVADADVGRPRPLLDRPRADTRAVHR